MLKLVRVTNLTPIQKNRLHYRAFHSQKALKHFFFNLLSIGLSLTFFNSGVLFAAGTFMILAIGSIVLQCVQSSSKCNCSKRVLFAPLQTRKNSGRVTLVLVPPILLAMFASYWFNFSYGFAFIFMAIWFFIWSKKVERWTNLAQGEDAKDLERQDIDSLTTQQANDLISYHVQNRDYDKADFLSKQLLKKLDES